MKIAFATCLRPPEPDPDAQPLLEAVRALGAEADQLAWDDPRADFGAYDLCVVRSTWNYIHHLAPFLDWAARVAAKTRLLNPLHIVRWNSDKAYLRDLKERGIRVVPTVYVPRGSPAALPALLDGRGWKEVVIKPQVGAGSFATRCFEAADPEAERFLRERAAERDMLVQPYVKSVEDHGERALVWIDGELTHAVRKEPRFSGRHESVSSGLPVAPDEAEFAGRALAPYAADLLYARVDVARGEDGGLMVMELELIEPSLFLLQEPRALACLASACVRKA
ncbi:MAG: hypothetical protein NTX64_13475 [Elusimicrobia bacterium]|nr:hypothetical protein [Elusimicrobiota bacterium]